MNIGGPAIQITGLMQNLSPSDFEQILLTGHCEKNELDYLEEREIKLPKIQLNGFGRSINFFADLKACFEIRKVIKTYSPDIIHTHTTKAGLLGRLAAISSFQDQIRVHTYHGHLLHGYFGIVKTNLLIWIESFLARYTDALIAVGEKVRDDLIAAGIGESQQYRVIAPGLKVGELISRDLALQTFDLPKYKFIVSWIGRVVAVKSPNRVIQLAIECRSRGSNVHFVVVGDGPLLGELKNRAELLSLPISFLGWQSEIEVALSFSDLVILTSENEGTPVALIQAQLAGIPVLSTDVGSVSEVLIDEKSGFCLSYSTRDFADRIDILSKNNEMKNSFGVIGKKNAIEKFSLSRLVTDHEALYRDLISQSNF